MVVPFQVAATWLQALAVTTLPLVEISRGTPPFQIRKSSEPFLFTPSMYWPCFRITLEVAFMLGRIQVSTVSAEPAFRLAALGTLTVSLTPSNPAAVPAPGTLP